MSDAGEQRSSKEPENFLGPQPSSPSPLYTYEGVPPPPYSTAPVMYPSPKMESPAMGSSQPAGGYQSFSDLGLDPGATSDTTPIIASSFDDKTVRRAFVRKVFSIVTLQLLFTFSVVCVFTFSSVVKDAVQTNLGAYISSIVIFAVVAISLGCCKTFSRTHPWNIVALVVVTLSLSYMVGTMASFHDTTAVVITMGATLAISMAIIAFSAQTRFDFTVLNGILLVLAVDLLMFGIFSTFYYSYMMDIVYGCLGALLYSLFLTIDCQLLMGAMSYRLSPEDYVNAALTIYLDIVLIFLYLLGRR